MNKIPSILELLSMSDSQFRLYDIGRKIDKISRDDFSKIENNQLPYPYPVQGHACFAIIFWQKKSPQPYLWFVKLPLDERGLLNQGARSHFVAIIVEALGSDLSVDPSERQEELLKNNPYHFTPAQYKLASLNSIINFELKKAVSEHYPACLDYISGKLGWENWHNIAIQGLTDFAVRLKENDNESHFIKALPKIHDRVLTPLCAAFENEKLSINIIDGLLTKIKKTTNNNVLRAQLLRSLSASCEHPHIVSYIDELFAKGQLTTDDFITLSGRCWMLFSQQNRLMLFLELMVESQDQAIFAGIFKDLVCIPSIRPVLFMCMRDINRSEKLSTAIGLLFNR